MNLAETIELNPSESSGAPKKIELYFGDITKQPSDEKIDLLMLSAYHGSYAPGRLTLIGALHHNLGINVSKLAKKKEVDLRKNFYCWWSRLLPDKSPFRRILCFETSNTSTTPQKAVKAIFKALIAAAELFDEGTVMTPLLCTGAQGQSPSAMLKAMVENSVTWMSNGLNINCLKIVVFRQDDKVLKVFQDLKRMHEVHDLIPETVNNKRKKKRAQASTGLLDDELEKGQMTEVESFTQQKKYDFYVSASHEAGKHVNLIQDLFKKYNSDLTFFIGELGAPDEEIFRDMKACHQVLTFLSPEYLTDDNCVDQYNAAWCLNRQRDTGTYLAPLLCITIANIPTYMALVQWIDIRVHEKMVVGVELFITSYLQNSNNEITAGKQTVQSTAGVTLATQEEDDSEDTEDHDGGQISYKYDIFVSYSHADSEEVNFVIQALNKQLPSIKLFVDRKELHTGGAWQQTLYHALEDSHITLACLSPSYIKSKMCKEEYRLSLARYYTENDFHLVPIQVVKCDDLPDTYEGIRDSSLPDAESFEHYVENTLVPALTAFITERQKDLNHIPKHKALHNLTELLEESRSQLVSKVLEARDVFEHQEAYKTKRIEILASSDSEDEAIAKQIYTKLSEYGFQTELSTNITDPAAAVVMRLDSADFIVPLVSNHFIANDDLVMALQVAINRQRYCRDDQTKLYPVLLTDSLELNDMCYHKYLNLLMYETCITDGIYHTHTIGNLMAVHPNFKEVNEQCIQLQVNVKKEKIKLREQGQSEDKLIEMFDEKSKENHRERAELRFVAVVVHRILYHLNHNDAAHEVLRDIRSFCRDAIMEEEELYKNKNALLVELQKTKPTHDTNSNAASKHASTSVQESKGFGYKSSTQPQKREAGDDAKHDSNNGTINKSQSKSCVLL